MRAEPTVRAQRNMNTYFVPVSLVFYYDMSHIRKWVQVRISFFISDLLCAVKDDELLSAIDF